MNVYESVRHVLQQLGLSVQQLSESQYNQPCHILSDATIGQHLRHVVELFLCLENGYASGMVNYDQRKRDRRIETDKAFALQMLNRIAGNVEKQNKVLQLVTGHTDASGASARMESNYLRELLYNLEHTVHHMALIRVGIESVSAIRLPESFGVASSTLQYRESCAR